MHWLDGVLAVPAIGIRIESSFKSMFDWQRSLAEFSDELAKMGERLRFKKVDVWGYEITVGKSGFLFEIKRDRILGQFSYVISQEDQPGGLPDISLPELKTYTELLEKIMEYLKHIFRLMSDLKGIEYDRIGIVADTGFDKDSLPPGLVTWHEHLGKPWDKDLISVDTAVSARLDDEETHYDLCHHSLHYSEEKVEKSGINFKLDWQRVFKNPSALKYKGLVGDLDACKEKALEYFEKFGEGDLKYG